MSATTTPAPARRATATDGSYRLSFPRLVRSETLKLLTLRSPWWSIAIVAVLSIGFSLLMAWAITSFDGGPQDDGGSMATMVILAPTTFTMLLAVILGAIQVTGEYSTGMMRSTLTAAPGRLGSLLAKTVVVAGFVFVSSVIIFAIAAAATAPIMARKDLGLDFSNPEVSLLPLLAGALTMAVIAIIGVATGYILRNGPGAIALGVGLVFVLPIVPAFFAALPGWEWIQDAARFLPSNAGQALMGTGGSNQLEPWAAGLTLVAWVVVGLIGASAVLKSRDA
ncbi:ABC-2 type transport system permease protein [Microbacterium sp. SORGH_AS428]|uniref:ABC transporter permease n=1 Tax=Microbacterium sp. SORGH_AS_0428 TaxID=3041788 RepID=UPI00285F8398|nr:ABC transporter permease [Microbacterium sp. SORGH_AS_0428]MDR6198268.1 ABC-2 type transport system permease protein [Microbacterium sp. SORGH_AS_0428]